MKGLQSFCGGNPYGTRTDLAAGTVVAHLGLSHGLHVVKAIYAHCFIFKALNEVITIFLSYIALLDNLLCQVAGL